MRLISHLVLVLLLPMVVRATIWHVDAAGSIQQAVNSSQNGDTVILADGFYMETVVSYGKNLTIGSQYLLDGDTSHVAGTIVTADANRPDTNSCFVYAYGEQGKLSGVTLEGGFGTWWYDGYAGGALYVHLSDITVTHCRIGNSYATYGGGIAATRTDQTIRTRLVLQDCVIEGCQATHWGGGLYAASCSIRVQRTSFISNGCGVTGGGAFIMVSRVRLDSCEFHSCWGQTGGASVSGLGGLVSNCCFDGNFATTVGPGICHYSAKAGITTTGCVFRNNGSGHSSIALQGTYINLFRFVGNVVEGNHAFLWSGTMLFSNMSWGEVAYNVFRANRNIVGGAICSLSDCRIRIHHNVFQNNVSDDPLSGSALASYAGSYSTLDSNIFIGNTGTALSHEGDSGPRTLAAQNNYWGDPSGPYHPTLNPTGLGDTLYQDSIIFTPWLTAPPDTTMPDLAIRERPEVAATWRLIAAYPNPFNSTVRLILAGFSGDDFSVTLHNLLGQEVAVLHRGPLTGGEILFTAPPTFASGVYFLRAADRLASQTRKVILLR